MKFIIKELETFTIVHFELEKPIKPEELKNLEKSENFNSINEQL